MRGYQESFSRQLSRFIAEMSGKGRWHIGTDKGDVKYVSNEIVSQDDDRKERKEQGLNG